MPLTKHIELFCALIKIRKYLERIEIHKAALTNPPDVSANRIDTRAQSQTPATEARLH